MYYISNFENLGEQKSITYANKYINNIFLGCVYHDQVEVNKFAPIIESYDKIPGYFLNLINELIN